MHKPNFFIIGAPKCGTTSLASWLAAHPQVYMSPIKEPMFFSGAMENNQYLQYETLFRGVDDDRHIAVGEASTSYLRSNVAVGRIEAYAPGCRYIVCLRNPVEMAPSWHEQRYFDGLEDQADFAVAWRLSVEQAGSPLGSLYGSATRFDYASSCKLGRQLERLYTRVDKRRVLPIVLDDVKADAAAVTDTVQSFLGLTHHASHVYPHANPAKERRSELARKLVQYAGVLKRGLGVRRKFGLLAPMHTRNKRLRARPALPPELTQELRETFHADIALLGSLIGRDLSHWIADAPDAANTAAA